MVKFTDFFEAWWFLNETEIFNHPEWEENNFEQSLDINVVKVNPETLSIDNDERKNTKVQVWLESGETIFDEILREHLCCHNVNYDSGGDTFEKAIIEKANLVYAYNREKQC